MVLQGFKFVGLSLGGLFLYSSYCLAKPAYNDGSQSFKCESYITLYSELSGKSSQHVVVGNTPAEFGDNCRELVDLMESHGLTLNSQYDDIEYVCNAQKVGACRD